MQFRTYFIDAHEHVRGAVDIEAPTVQAAMRMAESLAGEHSVELWRIDQFICRFEPIDVTFATKSQESRQLEVSIQG